MGGPGSGATQKKTLEERVLMGDKYSKRIVKRSTAPEKIGTVGEPPHYLQGTALEFWHENVPVLVGMRVLSASDRQAFISLCMIAEQVIDAYTAGEKLPSSLLVHYRALLGQFGMTPVTRGGLSTGEAKDKADEYAFLDS